MQLTSIIKGAPVERKGVRGVALFMRLARASRTFSNGSPSTPRYGRGTAAVEAKTTQAELSGEERLDSLDSDTIAEVLLPGRKTQLALSQKLSQNSCPLRDRHSRV